MQIQTNSDLYEAITTSLKRIENIRKYRKENPNTDPNAYEMNDLMFDVANIGYSGRKFEEESYGFLRDQQYSELRTNFYDLMYDLIDEMNADESHLKGIKPLASYFEKGLQDISTLNSLGDDETKTIFSMACGINLYVEQRKRDLDLDSQEIIYSNDKELNILLDKATEKDVDLNKLTPLLEDIRMAHGKTLKEYEECVKEMKTEDMEI